MLAEMDAHQGNELTEDLFLACGKRYRGRMEGGRFLQNPQIGRYQIFNNTLREGIVAVQSFDYKQAGFSAWWGVLLLGIAGAILGFFGLKNQDVAGATLSWLIGLGIISTGVSYLVALCGINRVEKHVKQFRANVKAAIDEQ